MPNLDISSVSYGKLIPMSLFSFSVSPLSGRLIPNADGTGGHTHVRDCVTFDNRSIGYVGVH
jgi:hypothetical protein